MNYVKLQIGCLITVLYITVIYCKETRRGDVKNNPLFDALLIISPWFIVLDGLTAWTVNHLDRVSREVNIAFHAMFYVLVDALALFAFLYMCQQTIGIPKKKSRRALMVVPFFLALVIMMVFLKDVEFVIGNISNYSMGVSVVACYVIVFLYFGMIFLLCMAFRHRIEKRKFKNIMYFVFFLFIVLLTQMIYKEALITSVIPTILQIAVYLNFENPSHRRLENFSDEMIDGFATLVERRDNSTGGHIRRTKKYVQIILDEMKEDERYKKILSRDFIKNMTNAAPMHDIGKISIPDYILQKPSGLTEEEFLYMRKHARRGGDIIKESFGGIEDPEFIKIAYEVARYHHEKWNGTGYPEGLMGTDIPLCARIVAVADVFDALSAKRCYRDAMDIDECFEIIRKGAGTDFDPEIVEVFLKARQRIALTCSIEQGKTMDGIQNTVGYYDL